MTPGECVTHHRTRSSRKLSTNALMLTMAAACVVTVAGCGSTSTPGRPSSKAVAASPTAPASSTIPLPPGIAKDSPQDLNSTKDMTGVITTVPGVKSIYIDYLPDICTFIPDSVLPQLGAATKMKGFRGSRLVAQACLVNPTSVAFGITVGMYINNIDELIKKPSTRVVNDQITVSDNIVATLYQVKGIDDRDPRDSEGCRVAWGTFYGAADVEFNNFAGYKSNPCDRAVQAAKAIAPYLPSRPIQMRPSE